MADTLAMGYRGIFVDDVNMLLRVGDGAGRAVAPMDPRTGAEMTLPQWRRYIAQFAAEIRIAFPQAEIVHNTIWYAGHDDPAIQRELRNADVVNLERGVNDDGLRGGSGRFSLQTFFAHVDWLHARGLLYVRSGACNGPELACNDDALACGVTTGAGDAILSSVVKPVVTAGTTYFIVVDGHDEESGNFQLTVVPPAVAAAP